ncbi:DUF4041 domain-containing protein [Bacteroides heparinolyticus]|uniref:DUF4041 domain-containing protein n=1 Tax=Prevotella heparinolytica TaxID=28113 RepID=UPI0035A02E8D
MKKFFIGLYYFMSIGFILLVGQDSFPKDSFQVVILILMIFASLAFFLGNKPQHVQKSESPSEPVIVDGHVQGLYDKLSKSNTDISLLQSENAKLKDKNKDLKQEIKTLTLTALIEYNKLIVEENLNSEEVKSKIALLEIEEKDLIEKGHALESKNTLDSKVGRSKAKQILKSFNSDVNSILINTTLSNSEASRARIIKAFEQANKAFADESVAISKDYLTLKLQRLDLTLLALQRKQDEIEQQKAIKEQMREEEKVRREIEAEKKKIEKEVSQFAAESKKLMDYLAKANSDIERNLYADKIKELEEKIKLLEEDKKRVFEREANTRAGFVYVISNIGSFGEDIYKIGMTRRLEPMDRVKELGDASVPFEFDVHAMIFSDDAPALETLLHQTFKDKQVNKVNPRKEFFKVSLTDIAELVKKEFNATTEFTMLAEAAQYRESLRIAETSNAAT